MGFKKQWTLEVSEHVLSLAWQAEQLVVTPSAGPISLAESGGGVLRELAGHGLGNGTSAVAGDVVATCGFDGKVALYGSEDSEAKVISVGKGWIEHVRWSPDGKFLGVPQGKSLTVLNRGGSVEATFPNHQTSVADLAWNPGNSNEVATVCGGGARMWRVGESEPFAKFDWGGASLLVCWSPDGRWIVTGDQTASVHLYDFARDYPLHIQGYETKVKAMDFSPDGKKLATGGGPVITVWDCTGKTGPEDSIPGQLKFHKGDVEAIAWSPDGKFLATGDTEGRLVFSDPKGKPVSAFQSEDSISALTWTSDGKKLAAGDASGQVTVFERVGG